MSQTFALISRAAKMLRAERGSLSIEHALLTAGGGGAVGVGAFKLADEIAGGFQTVLSVMS